MPTRVLDQSMLEERITRRFQQNARRHQAVAETLPEQVALAAEQLTTCLLGGNRILCCGAGTGNSNARHMTSLLVNRYERERPGLPALALPVEGGQSTTDDDNTFGDVLTHQVRALGQRGDVLVLFAGSRETFPDDGLLDAASDRGMELLILSDENTSLRAEQLGERDLEIAVPATDPASCHELHLSLIHCLCDLIDLQLFGEEL
ncbi:MAG: SIS domain-containing protein [Pseudomonadota bacterium]